MGPPPPRRHPVMLTKHTMTLYDLTTRRVWNRLTHRQSEADVALARELGDRVQEYTTRDRDGRPLRVVLQAAHDIPDTGGVYEFALTS